MTKSKAILVFPALAFLLCVLIPHQIQAQTNNPYRVVLQGYESLTNGGTADVYLELDVSVDPQTNLLLGKRQNFYFTNGYEYAPATNYGWDEETPATILKARFRGRVVRSLKFTGFANENEYGTGRYFQYTVTVIYDPRTKKILATRFDFREYNLQTGQVGNPVIVMPAAHGAPQIDGQTLIPLPGIFSFVNLP